MEKRVILAVVLCAGIYIVWQQVFPPPKPVVATAPSSGGNSVAPSSGASAPPSGGTAAPSVGGAGAPGLPAPAAPAAAPAVVHPERELELRTPAVRFVLSSAGATLKHAQLLESKYLLRPGDPGSGYDVIRTTDTLSAPLKTTFPDSSFPSPADGTWEVTQSAGDTVVFRAETDAVRIEKRYHADAARYRLQLDVTVENKSAKTQTEHLAIHLFARQDPNGKGGGLFGGSSANIASSPPRPAPGSP